MKRRKFKLDWKMPIRGCKRPIVYKHSACFADYTFGHDDVGRSDQLGVIYKPRHRQGGITTTQAREYYDILLNTFGFKEYIEGQPEVKNVIGSGIFVSSKYPTNLALTILSCFRYVQEYPAIVQNFLDLRKHIKVLSDWQIFQYAHKTSQEGGGIYGFNSNHALFSGTTYEFCNQDIKDILKLFVKDSVPHVDGEDEFSMRDVYRNIQTNREEWYHEFSNFKPEGPTKHNVQVVYKHYRKMRETYGRGEAA